MESLKQARMRLVETGGRTSQDLGAGRIVGQVLVYLYLQEAECSLDDIGDELGLSKASVSIAARQLEQLGLVKKVWKSGDRKNYYRSADNIASALQQGLLSMVRQKVKLFSDELDSVIHLLETEEYRQEDSIAEAKFLRQRVGRAKQLQIRFERIINNPILKLFETGKHRKNIEELVGDE